jgi:predicted amidohydrolase
MTTLVAVAQMTSEAFKESNVGVAEEIIAKASSRGAKLLSFPENFAFIGPDSDATFKAAEALSGKTISHFRNLAQKHDLWLSLGGFQESIPGSEKIYNSHVLISPEGEIAAVYRKIHLFSVSLPDGSLYDEEKTVASGQNLIYHETPYFKLGLTICYDLRFSYLFWALRKAQAQVILVPAAFTDTTGKAHWEILLRARAIETQSYILAAAQNGLHNGKRSTYGHAMIVDPWGTVIAQCGENDDIAMAEIDLEYLSRVRNNMPIIKQQRSIINEP